MRARLAVVRDRDATWGRRTKAAAVAVVAIALSAAAMLVLYALALVPFTPGIEQLRKVRSERPAVVRSADGRELATYRRVNREWVGLAAISRSVIDALISTEDHRFYSHGGIDWRRTLSSIVHTLGGDTQGGSTITQQLARNLFPEEIGRSATLTRKLKEMITAVKIESVHGKDEILEIYLNTVPFLYNAHGIEMAARTYFAKSAGRLDVLEAATLVGMLKGTSYYNPVTNPERARARRNVVLGQMAVHGKLPRERLEALRKRPLRLDFERQREPLGPAPHFTEHLRKWLIAWADRNGYDMYADGLVVRTTIDSRLQALADRAVDRQLDALQAVADVEWALPGEGVLSGETSAYVRRRRDIEPFAHYWRSRSDVVDAFIRESPAWRAVENDGSSESERLARFRGDKEFMKALRAEKTRLQAGFIALDPRNGHVKAWVGSRDFAQDQYDHVVQARRQPGSTFKPFVYAAALRQGMSPRTAFQDKAVEVVMPDGEVWRPTDAEAPTGEQVSLRQGLVHSRNTITVQVMQRVGPKAVAELAREMGVRRSKLEAVPSLALGTSLVSLAEMVSAYATVANGGDYIEPVIVTRIEDAQGNVLEEFVPVREPVLAPELAATLLDLLRGVVDEGTGVGIRRLFGIQADVAGKTGTTQDNADGWFILAHEQLVAGSWVGFNDSRVAMRSAYWGRGANNALFVVGDFFRQALEARLIDGRVARGAREREPGAVLERFGNWLGEMWDRRPRPQSPRWQRDAPHLYPDEEVFRRPTQRPSRPRREPD
ncbi:MAG TPA: transglycosylase domain-containing protein [Usitatibacter sp.]|nr:transglycosylase domain-containing protein [Usitatibacter sp.]